MTTENLAELVTSTSSDNRSTVITADVDASKYVKINVPDSLKPYHKKLNSAWSIALHEIIGSTNRDIIIHHLAKYVTSPTYQKYPHFMLHNDASARRAYRDARELYCINEIFPLMRK